MGLGFAFQSNHRQAVHLPKVVALPDGVRQTESESSPPAAESWDSWFDGVGATADFITERQQPADQQ